jgi:hypothetical protein
MSLTISLSSPPDREYLVADILLDDAIQVAEVNIELGTIKVEIYAHPEGIPWKLDFDEFYSCLNEAKSRLQAFYENAVVQST